jgi:hypothetical protein
MNKLWVRLGPNGLWHKVTYVVGSDYRFVCRSFIETCHPQLEKLEKRPAEGRCRVCTQQEASWLKAGQRYM